MKRLFVVIVALFVAVTTYAWGGFGVTAGLDFNSAKVKDVHMDCETGMNVGLTYLVDLPLGFSLQPSLVYSHKHATVNSAASASLVKSDVIQTVGSFNIPLSLQWGPDLIVARPFVDVTPYVGYSLVNKIKGEIGSFAGSITGENSWEYGLGIGAGINVWRLQAIVRYNWNFGALGNLRDFTSINVDDLKTDNPTYGGISVNVAFFF